MARTPIDQRPAVAQWLIRARASQGDAYTAARFLADLRDETGSAPDRATYAQWESGAVTPKDASLAPVYGFWAKRGVAQPAATPTAPALSYEEQHLELLRQQVEATNRQADATALLVEELRQARIDRQELADLRALVGQLAAERLSAGAREGQPTQPAPRV